jgi:uncharacterized membrane protein YgcG
MKHLFFLFFYLLTSFGASGQGFIVENCHVNIQLNKAGYFDVEEHYRVNFTTQKHGIFRTILTKYKLTDDAGKVSDYKIKIDKIDVPGWKFTTSYVAEANATGKMEIKIGDKNKYVEGLQEYVIKYSVHKAWLYRDKEVDFYWNIKSSEWTATFKNISFTISLPDNPVLNANDYFVYTGPNGNTQPDKSFHLTYKDGVLSGSDFSKNSDLKPYSEYGSSLTLLIKLPQDYIQQEATNPIADLWNNWGWIIFFPIVLIGYLLVYLRYGRKKRLPLVVNYFPPKNMDSAMAGFLINDKEDNSDLISLLPYWGTGGIITIEEVPKKGLFGKEDMIIRKQKELPDTAAAYESILFKGLFPEGRQEVKTSSLVNSFYTTMKTARQQLKQDAMKYYDPKTEQVSTITAVVLALTGVSGAYLFLYIWGNIWIGALFMFFCFFMLTVNRMMRRRNEVGATLGQELDGFRQFIKTAEQHKLEMLLKEDPGYFEKTMAFAYTFGMLKDWGAKFEALNVIPPQWYHSNNNGVFRASAFAHSFNSAISTAQSNMVSAPSSSSSSGGGSSGGGFGGGGGGGW